MEALRAESPWVHCHVASSYSLRYGASSPLALAERAAELGMDALALTDRDGLYGAVKHVRACQAVGLRPILGVDLALAGGFRVAMLACGRVGWASLCRLVSATHLAGERGEPVTTRELVTAHAEGLVLLLGPASDVGRALAERCLDLARARLARWRAGVHDLVLEVVHHYGPGDAWLAARTLRLADETGVPVVLTNAVRYLDRSDAPVADVLDAARAVAPLERRRVERVSAEGYLKSGKEMAQMAEEVCGPDGDAARRLLAATRRLADRCVVDPAADLGMGATHLPEVEGDPYARLRARCAEGLVRRAIAGRADARERLRHELAIIESMRLPAYFLTVADVADLIRSLGIRCSIRGSGAGSLVTYLLGISEVDPLAHDLVMERFCSQGREGLPDIDLDVESAGRLDAYRAVLDRYGDGRVACVSMMETYRARGAIREVAGAIGLPPHEIDQVAKAFPHIRARDIQAALRALPELRSSGLAQEQLAGVFRLAERLDGLPRQIALHPCGVVLSDATLPDRAPVERSFLGFPMTQFDKDDVEEMGLLKLDVIGVRMQSAISHALAEIRRTEGTSVDIDTVPRDDPATYDLIRTTHTLGCFQIESPGQRELVGKLQPETIDDLVVDISLFRPGPVNSDMVTPYLEARHGWKAPAYPHPDLVPALAETGGVVVFHEQVLRIIARMTGCSMSRAEEARRALGDPVGSGEVRAWFQVGASGRGYDPGTVERVWRVLASFGAFGFCKAHAAAFAVPTYQSAWLKAHHPAAFFAGVLTHEPGMYPTRALLDEARHFGVAVLPLDVNVSDECWRVERVGEVRWGVRVPLSSVKGISDDEVNRIVANRPYRSLPDLWYRAGVSRPVVERIVEVGGFDGLYAARPGRAAHPEPGRAVSVRRVRRPGEVTRRDLFIQISALERVGHGALHGQLPMGVEEVPAPSGLPTMSARDRVRAELDILGFEVSRHVISFYDDLLDALGVVRAHDLLRCRSGADVLVAGVKIATQTPPVRSGQRVIFATLDDATGLADVTFFQSVQERCAATVFGAWLLVVRGRVRRTGARGVSLRATHCWDLTVLYGLWREGGPPAVWEAMRPRDGAEPAAGAEPPRAGDYGRASPATDPRAVPALAPTSPYSDVARPGGPPGHPPRKLWHASPGSPGR